MRNGWKRVGLALLCYAGLSLDLTNHAQGGGWHQTLLNLVASLQVSGWSGAFLLIGLYYLFGKAARIQRGKRKWTLALPAAFFALNRVLGFSFARTGSSAMLWTAGDGQLLKTVFSFACWGYTAFCALKWLFFLLDRANLRADGPEAGAGSSRGFYPVRGYRALLRRHPFLTPFVSLWLLYLPLILISYPAVFMGDTLSIIVQGWPELRNPGLDYLTAENLLREGVYINQHHPALYTVCLHGFLRLGDGCFHSLNAGIFLFCLLQVTLVVSAFSFAASSLVKAGARGEYVMGALLYAAAHPQIRNFLMLVTKDSCYSACFLILVCCLFRWKKGMLRRGNLIPLILSALGVLLLRNEGRYVLILSGLLTALLDRKGRRSLALATVGALVISLGVYQVLYPLLGFTAGSVREALSVPFQQTARTLRDHPEDVSEEERAAIDGVLDCDGLAGRYNMIFADPVKETYRERAGGAELGAYFRTWLRMLARHPGTYLEATYGNYYQYFYPDETRMFHESYLSSDEIIQKTNGELSPLGIGFSLPAWSARWKTVSDSLAAGGLFSLPLFGLLMTPAFYTWALLALLCWTAGRGRGRAGLALCVLPALQLLIQFAGPTNGYYSRYMLPIVSVLPFLAGMLILYGSREEGPRTSLPAGTEKLKRNGREGR